MPVLTGGATSVVLSLLCFDIVTQRASYSSADVIWMVSVIPVLDVLPSCFSVFLTASCVEDDDYAMAWPCSIRAGAKFAI